MNALGARRSTAALDGQEGPELMRYRLVFVLTFAFVLATVPAKAQHKTAIYLDCPAEDPVGRSLCFFVRDNVRRSTAFSLALEPTDAFVRVRIHSVDKDTPPSGQASAVAVIMTLAKGDGYLHDQVLFVGRNAVETAATSISTSCSKTPPLATVGAAAANDSPLADGHITHRGGD